MIPISAGFKKGGDVYGAARFHTDVQIRQRLSKYKTSSACIEFTDNDSTQICGDLNLTGNQTIEGNLDVVGFIQAGNLSTTGVYPINASFDTIQTGQVETVLLESPAELTIKAPSVKFEHTDGSKGILTNIDTANIRHVVAESGEIDDLEVINVLANKYKIYDSSGNQFDLFEYANGKLVSDLPIDVEYVITQKITGAGTLSFEGFSEVSFGTIPVTGSVGGSSPWVYDDTLALYKIGGAIKVEGGTAATDVVLSDGEIICTQITTDNILSAEYSIRLADGTHHNMFQVAQDGSSFDLQLDPNFLKFHAHQLGCHDLFVGSGSITCNKIMGIDTLTFEGFASVNFGTIPVTGSNISGSGGSGFAVNADGEYIIDKSLQLDNHNISWTGSVGDQFTISMDAGGLRLWQDKTRLLDLQTQIVRWETAAYDSSEVANWECHAADGVYPNISVVPGDDSWTGPHLQQPRLRISPLEMAYPDDWEFEIWGRPGISNPTGKNAALEVFSSQLYWTAWSTDKNESFEHPIFSVAANPTLLTGNNSNLLNMDDPHSWSYLGTPHNGVVVSYHERPGCVHINAPTMQRLVGFSQQLVENSSGLADPDALVIRMGYTDQQQVFGDGYDPAFYTGPQLYSSGRGISLRAPVWNFSGGQTMLQGIREVTHIGRDYSTFGCSYESAATRDISHSYNNTVGKILVTIAPGNWYNQYETLGNKLDQDMLFVGGAIKCGGGNVHNLNYTLTHHVETDEERAWADLTGRLVSYTGLPGGNDHGVSLTDWKHGIMNHGLSKVALTEEGESVAWAGVIQGVSAAKDDSEIVFNGAVRTFQRYHGERETLEVADRGDAMCWLVLPLDSEIPVNPHMLSGKYQKQVDGIGVSDEVIMDVQDDYSFTITEHTSSIVAAIEALQASVNALLGQSHTHP